MAKELKQRRVKVPYGLKTNINVRGLKVKTCSRNVEYFKTVRTPLES